MLKFFKELCLLQKKWVTKWSLASLTRNQLRTILLQIKAYRDYESAQKPIEQLSEEDRLMIHFCRVERLVQKLQIMSFIGNFKESSELISPVSEKNWAPFIQRIFWTFWFHSNSQLLRLLLAQWKMQRNSIDFWRWFWPSVTTWTAVNAVAFTGFDFKVWIQ